MFVLFTAVTILWSTLVIKSGSNSHRIHYLMIVLCVFKALTLLSQAGVYVYLYRGIGTIHMYMFAISHMCRGLRHWALFRVAWVSEAMHRQSRV